MSVFDSLPLEKQLLIKKHLELVIEANKTTNLTRIDTEEQAMMLHVEDSLSALQELDAAPSGLYGDLGSGAGYPGIPLAIATGRETVLVDARQKKANLLDSFAEALELTGQVSAFAGRAELLARSQSKRFAALTARALAKLSVLMELASPLLIEGGNLICYKANIEDSELAHARQVQKMTAMKLTSVREFQLGEEYSRKIVVFTKSGKPMVKLPRQEGLAQKKPL